MALEALCEYAKKDTNRGLYNIRVEVQATSMGNFTEQVSLDRDNWAVQQHVNVYPVWGSVRGRAQGTGIALMQVVTCEVEREREMRGHATRKKDRRFRSQLKQSYVIQSGIFFLVPTVVSLLFLSFERRRLGFHVYFFSWQPA